MTRCVRQTCRLNGDNRIREFSPNKPCFDFLLMTHRDDRLCNPILAVCQRQVCVSLELVSKLLTGVARSDQREGPDWSPQGHPLRS